MEPIKFQPLLKSTIWGGNKIIPFKHLDSTQENVGESWEISGVKDNETIVKNGAFAGKKLNEVVAELKGKLIGEENYKRFGNEFPLLIKFIDARQQLSIQVHPTDELAQKRGKERGKTEMWYIMDSDKDAKLRSGLKKAITPEEYKAMVENDTITDAFDVTYRIYDFKRKDKDGNERQLHTKEAAECINYHVESDYRTNYIAEKDRGVSLVQCNYFTTSLYDLTEPMTIDYSELDSFVILIGMKGEGTVTDNEGNTFTLAAGETVLIPATTKSIKTSGTMKFLETYI